MTTYELRPLGDLSGMIVYRAPQREAHRLAALRGVPVECWRVTTKTPVRILTAFPDGSIAKEHYLHEFPQLVRPAAADDPQT